MKSHIHSHDSPFLLCELNVYFNVFKEKFESFGKKAYVILPKLTFNMLNTYCMQSLIQAQCLNHHRLTLGILCGTFFLDHRS